MPNFRLLLEYDGRAFAGWQQQAGDAPTVQGALMEAIERVTGQRVRVVGSGRTDAGVHAEAQVASAAIETELGSEALQRALNGVLPRAIAVLALDEVGADFDAQRSARRKRYVYRVWNARVRSPLRADRFLHVPQPLDVEAMRRAAADLLGEHDFSAFRAAGSDVRTSVREILVFEIEGGPGGEIAFVVEGRGFLRYMVRNLVGTLLEVGTGRRPADGMPALLSSGDRGAAGPTAAAHGLTLESVHYEAGEG